MKFFCSQSKERLSTPGGAEEAEGLSHTLTDVKLKLFPLLFLATGRAEQEERGRREKEEKEASEISDG